ncbi:MAG: hypothetical protein AAGG48_17440 [Planctomycetota bacterium]
MLCRSFSGKRPAKMLSVSGLFSNLAMSDSLSDFAAPATQPQLSGGWNIWLLILGVSLPIFRWSHRGFLMM